MSKPRFGLWNFAMNGDLRRLGRRALRLG